MKTKNSKFAYIYSITYKPTGKIYIGSTNRILKVRWLEHKKRLRNGDHVNRILQADYDNDPLGVRSLHFKFVERCTSDNIHEREQYWIDYHKEHNAPGVYNTGEDAHLVFKGRKHSDETRKKIAATLTKTLRDRKAAEEGAEAIAEAEADDEDEDEEYDDEEFDDEDEDEDE